MANPNDAAPAAETETDQRAPEDTDRRVAERRLFPPRPEGRRHDGGRRAHDSEDA